MKNLGRIQAVERLDGFHVRMAFTDGTQKVVDLEPFMHGPIFQPLRDDEQQFATMKVDPKFGTIVWDNGADIDPDVLYHGLQPDWMTHEVDQPRKA